MHEPCSFSSSTKEYLFVFYDILDHMIQGMEGACLTDSISQNFIVQMIPHHQGAIAMSLNALRYCICPELVPILNTIIISQEKGVKEMQKLLS